MLARPAHLARPLCALLCLFASACSELEAPPLYVDTAYQLRCLRCDRRVPDSPARTVEVIDGERGISLSCQVSGTERDRHLNFSLAYQDPDSRDRNYRLELSRVTLNDDEPGSACRIRLREGVNNFEGRCTGDEPTDNAPCQVSIEEEAGIIEGSVFCNLIGSPEVPTDRRYLVKPGTTDEAFEVEIHGCGGL